MSHTCVHIYAHTDTQVLVKELMLTYIHYTLPYIVTNKVCVTTIIATDTNSQLIHPHQKKGMGMRLDVHGNDQTIDSITYVGYTIYDQNVYSNTQPHGYRGA